MYTYAKYVKYLLTFIHFNYTKIDKKNLSKVKNKFETNNF